jgi:hypothetical protein
MAFLFGTIGEPEVIKEDVRRARAAAKAAEGVGAFGEKILRRGRCLLLCRYAEHLASLVGVAEDERYSVVCVGFAFTVDGSAADIARRTLRACGREGRVQPPAGHYALVVIDHVATAMCVYVDHLATSPVYYHQWKDRAYFASELKGLLPVGCPGKHWNRAAVAHSYLLGYMLDEETICREIRYLPGGSCLTMGGRELCQVSRYHEFAASPTPTSDLSQFHEVADECLSGTVNSVHRTFRDMGFSPLVTISGGLDSRAVMTLLSQSAPDALESVGWGKPGSADELGGRAVAEILGARHTSYGYAGGSWLLDVMDEAVSSTECMYSYLDAARIHQMLKQGLPNGRAPLYTGLSGDMIMGSFINWRDLGPGRLRRGWAGLARRMATEYTNVSFYGFADFRRHIGPDLVEGVIDSLTASLEKNHEPSQGYFNFLDRWNLRNKQARGIFAYFQGARASVPVVSPFYHPKLIEHLRRMPIRHRFCEAAYVRYLYRDVFSTQLASIPWQKSGTVPLGNMYLNIAYTFSRKMMKRAVPSAGDPFSDPLSANPYNLWLAQDRPLRERIHDSLTPAGSGDVLGIGDRQLRSMLSDWVEHPDAYRAINLNLIYMLSVVRFADAHGRFLNDG